MDHRQPVQSYLQFPVLARFAAGEFATTTNFDALLEDAIRDLENRASRHKVERTLRKHVEGLADYLPEAREQIYAFLALLIAILSLLYQMERDQQAPSSVDVVICQGLKGPHDGGSEEHPKLICRSR